MARGYKLRLGDGTTFAVDEKGLLTWLNGGLVDEKTRVQPAGSTQWLSIRQMIAAERTAQERLVEKRIAAQHEAAAETKAAERAVAEARAAEQREAAARAEQEQRQETEAGLALARQAHEERIAAEREASRRVDHRAAEERAAAERLIAAQRAEEERRAEAERRIAAELAEAERRAAAESRDAAERKAAKARQQAELRAEMARQAEREKRAAEEKAAAERAAKERAEAERQAALTRKAEEERRAVEERRIAQERAEAERQAALARKAEEERRAAEERRIAEERAAAEKKAAADRKAAAERRAAEERAEAERQEAAERVAAEQRAAEERAAAELRAAMASQAEKERRAVEERRAAEARAAAERRAAYGVPEHVTLEPLASGLDLEPLDEDLPPAPYESAKAPSLRIALRPLDDEPRPVTMFEEEETPAAAPLASSGKIEALEAGVTDMMETLRPVMEPIDEQVSAWTRWQRRRAAQRGEGPPAAERLAGVTRPAIDALEGAARFALALGPRLRSGLRSIASWRPARASAPPTLDLSQTAPAVQREPMSQDALELTAIAELIESPVPPMPPVIDLPRAPDPPPAPIRVALTAPPRPAASPRPEGPAAVPPPPLAQIPVIPFAKGWQPGRPDERSDEPEQIYGEDEPSGALRTTLVWVRRTSIAAALLVGAGLLATRYSSWVPQTRDAAVSLFSGMDQLKTRVAPSAEPGSAALVAAVAASSEQLPVLGVETIQLIMNSSGQALEPVDVLRRTFVALDRARPSLAQSAAAELDSLTAGLAAELPVSDGRWLREYLEKVRSRTVTVNYEDTKALWLLSRAARRLPAERLSRLQQVLGAAVSMGLQPRTSPDHAQS